MAFKICQKGKTECIEDYRFLYYFFYVVQTSLIKYITFKKIKVNVNIDERRKIKYNIHLRNYIQSWFKHIHFSQVMAYFNGN